MGESAKLAARILEKGKPHLCEYNTDGTAIQVAHSPVNSSALKEILDWFWAIGFQAAQTESQIETQAPTSGVVNMADLRTGLEKMLIALPRFSGTEMENEKRK
jgi:hypothetical protein